MRVSDSPSTHNYKTLTQNGFAGINHNLGAKDGEIFSMMNMNSDFYPLLATRKEGIKAGSLPETARKLFAFKIINEKQVYLLYETRAGGGYWVNLYYDGHEVGRLNDSPVDSADYMKTANIIGMGNLVCVYCNDKSNEIGNRGYVYDIRAEEAEDYTDTHIEVIKHNPEQYEELYVEGKVILTRYGGDPFIYKHFIYADGEWQEFTPFYTMDRTISDGVSFEDGTLGGVAAAANTIKLGKPAWWSFNNRLSVGDSVAVKSESNNKTATIREIEEDQAYVYLRFYENTWTNGNESATISLEIPQMDYVFEHSNRLWGFKGRAIYCSCLGEPARWYTYESTADSAWAVKIGEGVLTGGCSYEYPVFFTEDKIYTILGTEPDNFTFSITPSTYGCAKGSWDSFAIVGAYLYYHSPWGFVRYTGGLPQLISKDISLDKFKDAHGGGAGNKYYVTCTDINDEARCFVFDAIYGVWHEQTAIKDACYAADGDVVYSATWHGIWAYYRQHRFTEPITEFDGEMESEVVFAPIRFSSLMKKQIKTIYIRYDIEAGGSLSLRLFEDGKENDSFSRELTGKGVAEITGRPHRSDEFQIKLGGRGQWKVYAIALDLYEGSVKK